MNLNPAPSKTTKERAPANSKAGAPGKDGASYRLVYKDSKREKELYSGNAKHDKPHMQCEHCKL